MSSDLLTITEVSRRSGVASSALRFYESKGLIASERAGSGHRRYTARATAVCGGIGGVPVGWSTGIAGVVWLGRRTGGLLLCFLTLVGGCDPGGDRTTQVLRRYPSRRFASASEFSEALAYAAGLSVKARATPMRPSPGIDLPIAV